MTSDIRPLDGVRICELGVALAGPVATRFLAHFGAEVVKIEAPRSRQGGSGWLPLDDPKLAAISGDTGTLADTNAGKLSLALDLKHPAGREAADRLLKTCDVFITNLAADAIRGLRLDYESVRAVNPNIIYVASHGFGTKRGLPYSDYTAWGPNQLALAGSDQLTGHADGPPAISTVAYLDFFSAFIGATGILTALEHRDQTGEGQFIDVSQMQGAVSLVGPLIMDAELTGHIEERDGNRLRWMAPNGVYRCRGVDEWVAISVLTDDEWCALGRVAGSPAWASDRRFATVEGRLAAQVELDGAVGSWTAHHTAQEIAEWLQAAGVAAFEAYDQSGVIRDAHLGAREYWQFPPDYRFGPDLTMGLGVRLSDTPARVERGATSLGEHTDRVLREMCGYSDEEIERLVTAGAASRMLEPDLKLKRPYMEWAPLVLRNMRWPA